MRKNTREFTLAELLIVIAIIAVMVAVSIPIFTGQLRKAREAVDLANMRTAKAVASIYRLEGNKLKTVTGSGVEYKRTRGRFSCPDFPNIPQLPGTREGKVVD